ncbi:MAG: hypothetical protein KH446_11225 [Oscillibacter sp.]|uniref:hypothetical protein n=1 Tax=Oscillibacter sp. TaxID=1945593 RepID=UPI001D25252C|nr:hypothetical protein [Oscillibacter sp.]MBS6292260.1 hypothetical protein [Oscillibacter sp.]
MNVFGNSSKQLLQALTANAENETMDYVLREMQAVLGEEMPEEDALRTYLQNPDKPTELSTTQQIVALDMPATTRSAILRTVTVRPDIQVRNWTALLIRSSSNSLSG